ncbi:cellulose synthase catalytic subunit [Pseudarthrobacter sp. H3Y2-7]|uniref:glycosyltransferase family 2 protein n=1 Tax=Pseudarthrobacter naphthalenicus TaxID=3031328 RepID=UPI0023B0B669|nr:cellulose synthase catalytic subunit [Pseudarthrobacter sp. H3Y2-7]MDE8667813.1 cellulose synthase catalytic subunit [Pseudarthrobacter sp. H3Y2-7]
MTSLAPRTAAPEPTLVTPPNDQEKYAYIKGPQHRWFFWAHALAFVGIAISFYGFSRMEYWTLVFLIPLAMYAAETLLGLRTSTYRRNVTLPDHLFMIETWAPENYPSVDVFLPTAGEPLEILKNTYGYVSKLDYAGTVTVYVLDDMGREEVRTAAMAHGFEYLARPGNEFKKAGNLRYAFDRTDGDVIAIFDADFVPRPEFLSELLPYLDDPSIGIVQSPQFFSTPKSMHWLERTAGATQEIFYRLIQVSRDSVNAAICCGTSALYRRSALGAIGGFPPIAHSEDVFTGIEMDKAGYRLQYVPVNLSQGICPDTIDSFITQQYRWCEGSMELLKGEEFHATSGLDARQRLSFWSGFIYYATTAMNAFFAPLPILIMVLVFPQYMAAANFLPLVPLLVLWLVIYPLLLTSRWRLDVLRAQLIYSFTHAVAIFDVFFGRTSEWVPSHGSTKPAPLAIKVKRLIVGYIGVTFGAVLAGLAWRLSQPEYSLADWWAAVIFVGVNAYVFVPVLLLALGIDLPRLALTSRKHRKETDVTERLSDFDQNLKSIRGDEKGARA